MARLAQLGPRTLLSSQYFRDRRFFVPGRICNRLFQEGDIGFNPGVALFPQQTPEVFAHVGKALRLRLLLRESVQLFGQRYIARDSFHSERK